MLTVAPAPPESRIATPIKREENICNVTVEPAARSISISLLKWEVESKGEITDGA